MLGWTVLSRLKQDPTLRHIPVQMLTLDEDRQHGLARGAYDFISKPIAADELSGAIERVLDFSKPRRRRLLVVEDDPTEQFSIRELIAHDDVEIARPAPGEEALQALRDEDWDCVVLDLRLPDMSGFDVLERLRADDDAARRAGRGLHRQGTVAGRRRAAAHHGAQHRRQGRGIAGASARRNRALPAPRGLRPAAREAAHARAPARLGRGSDRPHRAAGRRRRAQHLRAVELAGTPRHERADRHHRPRSDRAGADRCPTSRWC